MKNKIMNQKGISPILIILIIVGVLVAAGGAWYWQSQRETDETASWKTYRNEEYGFEVKYPEDWNHSSDVMAENFGKRFVKDSNEFVCNTLISTIQTEKFDEYSRTAYPSERQRTAIRINDISAVKIESRQDLGLYGDYLIERTDGVKFSIQITQMIEKFIVDKDGDKVAYGTVNDPDCIDVFNQILSTFKFIDTGESDDLGACNVDSDCACGRKIGTNECFFGNKKYVNTVSPCPDFCSGIDGKMRIKCVNNICTPVR